MSPSENPPAKKIWQLSRARRLDLSAPAILAILNLTPDSFSDGGSYPTLDAAVLAAEAAVRDGAHALDIGGESTRPGAQRVPAAEQIRRVVPLIEAIRARPGPLGEFPITVDTTLAAVARAALGAGADVINDVSGGEEDPEILPLAAERGAGVILMHRLRPPESDSFSDRYREAPVYPGGVVAAVRGYLADRAGAARAAGIGAGSIVLDPGLGFGKTVEQNLELIRSTESLVSLGFPVLSGLSRKSFVGRASGLGTEVPARERVAGTIALSVAHLLHGASIFRVHDVAAVSQALRAAATLVGAGEPRAETGDVPGPG